MSDPCTLISQLRRPRLLVRAARFGLPEYRRERDLRRLIGRNAQPEDAVNLLLTAESRAEENRRKGEVTYSPAQHIELLIALVAEGRLARKQSDA